MLKRILKIFGIKNESCFLYLKLKELYMKIKFSKNESKEKYIQKKFKEYLGYRNRFFKRTYYF